MISAHSVAPAALGLIEGIIGTSQKAFHIVTRFGDGDTQRRSYSVQHLIRATNLDPQRLNFQAQLLSKSMSTGEIKTLLQDYTELFTPTSVPPRPEAGLSSVTPDQHAQVRGRPKDGHSGH